MIVIDIRSRLDYEKSHIKDSINIDEYELTINYKNYLRKDKEYLIYCTSGIRSKRIVNYLKRLGYNVNNLEGGYNNYLLQK